MMEQFFKILGYISSICSIVALPIAIWQILALKSKVVAAEKAINNMMNLQAHEKAERIIEELHKQEKNLSKIMSAIRREGTSESYVSDEIQKVIDGISDCIIDLPSNFKDANNSLQAALQCLKDFFDDNDKNHMNDAEHAILNGIDLLKELSEKAKADEIKQMAKQ